MELTKHIKTFKIIALIIVFSFLYVYFSSPGGLVINTSGEAEGIVNEVRLVVQGNRFLNKQLIEVNKELEWELGEPKRNAEMNRELRVMARVVEAEENKFYREQPDMRPSRAETRTEALRDKADAIEQRELDREMEKYRKQRITELRKIIRLIEGRLKNDT